MSDTDDTPDRPWDNVSSHDPHAKIEALYQWMQGELKRLDALYFANLHHLLTGVHATLMQDETETPPAPPITPADDPNPNPEPLPEPVPYPSPDPTPEPAPEAPQEAPDALAEPTPPDGGGDAQTSPSDGQVAASNDNGDTPQPAA